MALNRAKRNLRFVTGSWAQLAADAKPIRYEVFVLEQQVPLELEWDEMDEVSLHIVAYKDGKGNVGNDSNDHALGTARLLPNGHIGRMAVRQSVRGMGIGSVLLQTLLREAQQRGDAAVLLSAQIHAENFYQRHGFVREGEEFIEAGIPHISMRHVFAAD